MILVAGGSGTLGSRLVQRLLSRGLPVRVLTRDATRVPATVESLQMVEGDVRNPASLRPALADVDTVVSAVHGFVGGGRVSPASVDRDGNVNLIDAAAAAGAAVVLMSVVGASADSPMELFRMKHAAEQHLQASGVPWTIVRATAYLEMWVGLLEATSRRSGRPLVFGRGDNPNNFVAAADVATLLERVVTDPSTRGRIFEIGGPENLSFNQLAAEVQRMAGGHTGPRHVPRAALHAMCLVVRPFRPDLARQARAALVLDSADMTFDASPVHRLFPDLPSTPLAELLARRAAGTDGAPVKLSGTAQPSGAPRAGAGR